MEEEEVEVPVTKEPTKMETDEATAEAPPAGTGETDVNMDDTKTSSNASGPAAENGVPEVEDKPVHMETDTKVCDPAKWVVVVEPSTCPCMCMTLGYHCQWWINISL